MTSSNRSEESLAAAGARWTTVAMVLAGLANYGYALLLTHLLNVGAYSRFSAGQSLVLWASTVANSSVPWVLAQALARATTPSERSAALRFAKLAAAGSGLVTAVVVAVIAARIAGPASAIAIAISTFIIFLSTATTGWLQGQGRLRKLSILSVGSSVLKFATGVLLVTVVGLGTAGALAALGFSAALLLFYWPRISRTHNTSWRAALVNRDLWRKSVAMTSSQGLVSLFIAVDIIIVAVLPSAKYLAASYQASAALSRVPFYVADAVAMAFFPSLSRSVARSAVEARAVRMYAAMAVPLAAIASTVPESVLAAIFPAQYGAVESLLKYTAVTGLAAGAVSVIVAFFQAADDYTFLGWLLAGLVLYVCALLAGWREGGVTGLAIGGSCGSAIALMLLGYRLIRLRGRNLLAEVPMIEPLIAIAMLVLLHGHALLWLGAASAVGLWAILRFIRPGARHRRTPGWVSPGDSGDPEVAGQRFLTQGIWLGLLPKPSAVELDQASILARRNRIEGRLAALYPQQLPDLLAETQATARLFANNLRHVDALLRTAGIPMVLLNVGRPSDHLGNGIDIVVPDPHWHAAIAVLDDWYVKKSVHRAEGALALLFPASGPEVHLRNSLSWFGLPMLEADRLLQRSRRSRSGILVPASADFLRICLAQAVFVNLTLNLSQLLAFRTLLNPRVVKEARSAARSEGWLDDFDSALSAAARAVEDLDRGLLINLPVPMPLGTSLRGPTIQTQPDCRSPSGTFIPQTAQGELSPARQVANPSRPVRHQPWVGPQRKTAASGPLPEIESSTYRFLSGRSGGR